MAKNKASKAGKPPNAINESQGSKKGAPYNATGRIVGQKRKFSERGKKRKTFLGRCRKLLNNMLELDDSKPFRTAVDRLKYPDYHTVVRYDIDLSKISTKLDTGQYPDPIDFGQDIRLMISNWNDYIKDASLPIYGQISRLKWFFEGEYSKILNAFKDHQSKKGRIEDDAESNSAVPAMPVPSASSVPTPPHLLSSVVGNGRLRITRAPGLARGTGRSNMNMLDLRNQRRNNNRSLMNQAVHRPVVSRDDTPANSSVGSTGASSNVTSSGRERLLTVLGRNHVYINCQLTAGSSAGSTTDGYGTNRITATDQGESSTQSSSSAFLSRNQAASSVRHSTSGPVSRAPLPRNVSSNGDMPATQGRSQSTARPLSNTNALSKAAVSAASPNHSPASTGSTSIPAAQERRPSLAGQQRNLATTYIRPNATAPVSAESPNYSPASTRGTSIPAAQERRPSLTGQQRNVAATCIRPTATTPVNAASPHRSPATTPATQEKPPELELLFGATHVWYGEFKNKPFKEIRFTERGLEFPIKAINKEALFCVRSNEIIRSCGHFGNLGKLQNTLFIFLSPTATKRLRTCVKDLGVTAEVCSLIVIFGQDLTTEKVSRLIHIFWVIGRQSIFGQLFSEVDKKGALAILANIKPQILMKLTIGAKDAGSNTSTMSLDLNTPSVSSPNVSSPRCVPNLAAARIRRNSSTDVSIASSTTQEVDRQMPAGNRMTTNASKNRHLFGALPRSKNNNNTHGFTFHRSRLMNMNQDVQNGPGPQNPHSYLPPRNHGPEPGSRPYGGQYNMGGQRFEQSNEGPNMHRPNQLMPWPHRYHSPRRNLNNQNYVNDDYQSNFNRGPFDGPHEMVNYDPAYDQLPNDNGPPWLRGRMNNPYRQPQHFNSDNFSENNGFIENVDVNDSLGDQAARIGSTDFTQDVDLSNRHGEFIQQNNPETDQVEQGQHEPQDIERDRDSCDDQTSGIGSTEDQHSIQNSSADREERYTIGEESLEPVSNQSIEHRNPSQRHLRKSLRRPHQNQILPCDIGTSALETAPPLEESCAPSVESRDNTAVESSVSSTDQTLNEDVVLHESEPSQPELLSADMDSDPVSSSAPTGETQDDNVDDVTPVADDCVKTREEQSAGYDCRPESDQVEVDDKSSDEDDVLEIIIPSDTEEELAFLPASHRTCRSDDGEDLVMMATRISIKCPVTQQVMRRPVKNRHCGHCYDRDGIQQVIINRHTKARCPVPGCSNSHVLAMEDMEFDPELFDHIRSHSGDSELMKELDAIHKELMS